MPRPFVRHYDTIYADKDYGKDVADFEALLGTGSLAGMNLLEIGAGTGNHTLRLAPRVGRLVSVEIDPDFFELLRAKLASAAVANTTSYALPLQELPESGFDAAAAFFHVLNYIGCDDMGRFLAALAVRLKPGAAFVADLWNGAAAIDDPPREEWREKKVGSTRVMQHIRPEIAPGSKILTLHYDVALDCGAESERFAERLVLYLWSREELESMLCQAGFSGVEYRDYGRFPADATSRSWRLWMRAVRH